MELTKLGFNSSQSPKKAQLNYKAELSNKDLDEISSEIPDIVYKIRYKLYEQEYVVDLKPLFQLVDVTKLSDIATANLRVQLDRLGSINLTLQVAYEQLMEEYEIYKINYEIWFSTFKEKGREIHWESQLKYKTTYDLAKSSMSPPTQVDILHAGLQNVGLSVDYEDKQKKLVGYERNLSLLKSIMQIVHNRQFALKTIIDSRTPKEIQEGQ
jgi:hypothetical protein